jgi:hypothetical protein
MEGAVNLAHLSATPVLLMGFNRPDHTRAVLAAIRKAAPTRLFVALDGPRAGDREDADKCRKVRDIFRDVGWNCEIHTLFRDANLGCRCAPSDAINWFFSNVEEGIILEDDCVPDPSFFRFCEELLARYRKDERIMMISGDNFQLSKSVARDSYYFTRYTHIWGWASWRRAWAHCDMRMSDWPCFREKGFLLKMLGDKKEAAYWTKRFDRYYAGKISAWSYAWLFACWSRGALNILPSVNLVSNIGFGDNSTNTAVFSDTANLEKRQMKFPLAHPENVCRNTAADSVDDRTMFSRKSLYRKMRERICSF